MTERYPTEIRFTCTECGKEPGQSGQRPRLVMSGPRVMWECPHCHDVARIELPPRSRRAFAELLDDPLSTVEIAEFVSILGNEQWFTEALEDLRAGKL